MPCHYPGVPLILHQQLLSVNKKVKEVTEEERKSLSENNETIVCVCVVGEKWQSLHARMLLHV